MPCYLLEVYVSKADSLPQASEEARRLADAGELRYVRTTFLREDETCFHVFEAPSREAVVEAARRARFPDPRVTEAVENVFQAPSAEELDRAGRCGHLEFDRIVEVVESATPAEPKEEK